MPFEFFTFAPIVDFGNGFVLTQGLLVHLSPSK